LNKKKYDLPQSKKEGFSLKNVVQPKPKINKCEGDITDLKLVQKKKLI